MRHVTKVNEMPIISTDLLDKSFDSADQNEGGDTSMLNEAPQEELSFGQSIGAAGAPTNPIPILEPNNFQVAPNILQTLADNLEAEV